MHHRLFPFAYIALGLLVGFVGVIVTAPERTVVVEKVVPDPAAQQQITDLTARAKEWELRTAEAEEELAKARSLNGRILRQWQNAEAAGPKTTANRPVQSGTDCPNR